MAGISGAFLLMPFQVSVLGLASPSASATNHLFNIVATPGGILRYIKERRMLWPLGTALIVGSLPGALIGTWIRIEYLPGSGEFKLFAGFVLLYIGVRLLLEVIRTKTEPPSGRTTYQITSLEYNLREVSLVFDHKRFSFSPSMVILIAFFVGIIGSIYGVGGGVIIVPFLLAYTRLPIHLIAGAALLGTFAASAVSTAAYQGLSTCYPNLSVGPVWKLGFLLGAGGLAGTWLGGSCQKYVSARRIKLILCVGVLAVAMRYVAGFWI